MTQDTKYCVHKDSWYNKDNLRKVMRSETPAHGKVKAIYHATLYWMGIDKGDKMDFPSEGERDMFIEDIVAAEDYEGVE